MGSPQSWQGGWTQQPNAQKRKPNTKLIVGISCAAGGAVLLLIGLFVVVRIVSSSGDDHAAANPPTAGGSASTGGSSTEKWETFTSNEGGFSVELPGTPDVSKLAPDEGTAVNEATAASDLYLVNVTWGVGLSAAQQAQLKANLGDSARQLAETRNGSVQRDQPISINGFPGREVLVVVNADGQWRVFLTRTYLVNDAHYQLSAIWERQTSESPPPQVDRFFASFKLLDATSPAPVANPPAQSGMRLAGADELFEGDDFSTRVPAGWAIKPPSGSTKFEIGRLSTSGASAYEALIKLDVGQPTGDLQTIVNSLAAKFDLRVVSSYHWDGEKATVLLGTPTSYLKPCRVVATTRGKTLYLLFGSCDAGRSIDDEWRFVEQNWKWN